MFPLCVTFAFASKSIYCSAVVLVVVKVEPDVPIEFEAFRVSVYVVETARPVSVYGEPVVNVALTVDPEDGVATRVFLIVEESFVNATVTDEDPALTTVKLVGVVGVESRGRDALDDLYGCPVGSRLVRDHFHAR